MNQFLSTALTLFFVMDAIGSIPTYLSVLESVPANKRRFVAGRELFFSIFVLLIFFFAGDWVINLLEVEPCAVTVSGGVVLFIVAMRMIFSKRERTEQKWQPGKHFFVPIATPIIGSPSFFGALMVYTQNPRITDIEVFFAMIVAWLFSVIIYWFAEPISRGMKEPGLTAFQRFTGLLVALIAVQKILIGIKDLWGSVPCFYN